jgi:hypothetical protein
LEAVMHTARLLALLLLIALGSVAGAVEIRILPGKTESLEIRDVTLPGGETTKLYVITGSPVRLEVDGDRITAERIEFDSESRLLRIIGAGDVAYDDVATKGRNYLLDMGSGELAFEDVFIFTAPIDIEGVQATRRPGQIDISAGAFSPCSRCNQPVQDYRFTAERMNLYPGDRLVAFNVTVYIRELPSFFLPLMVVPLGPPERQPRFRIQRGSTTERAEVDLDWPYVFGPNALGTVSLRYFADVTQGLSSSPTENILGGTVTENYFGGGFDHRFYTAQGEGALNFFYTPAFEDEIEIGGRTQDEYQFGFRYATEEALEGLQADVLLNRDDAVNQRILDLTVRLSDSYGGFDFSYVTQTYFDLNAGDPVSTPAYEESEGALRTYAQLRAAQGDDLTFTVGPFSLSGLQLELGIYEDYANSANASAASSPIYINDTPVIRSGRLRQGQTLTLEAFSPFSGASLSGSTDFLGQYYSTTNPGGERERLVDWNTVLNFEQTFAGGSFGLDLNRTILEGESPFSFDAQITPANRSDLATSLQYSPLEWLDLSIEETYVFEDSRDPNGLGAGPIETRLELFNNLGWFNASLEQRYDIKENDPGLLGASATLNTPDTPLQASFTLSGAYDLLQDPGLDGRLINESEADFGTELRYGLYTSLDVALGYDYNGDPDDFEDNEDFGDGDFGSGFEDPGDVAGVESYKPLELGLTLGTETQEDFIPSLRVTTARDLNSSEFLGEPRSLGLEAAGRVGPIELSASQSFDFENGDASDSEFTLAYPNIIELQGAGFQLLPPSFVGLVPDPENSTTYELRLSDLTQQDVVKLYELSYQTTYGPLDVFGGGGAGLGFSDTALNAQLEVPLGFLSTGLGALGFGVSFSSTLAIADDLLLETYLSNSDLTLTTDFFSRFALQGTLAYAASYDTFGGVGLSDQTLTFTDFGGTVRFWDDLYLSAIFNDSWDFIDPSSTATPYNFQPTFYLTLDRCCWALYAAYNTQNGTVSLTLGYPGSTEGVTGAFNTNLRLPRREYE